MTASVPASADHHGEYKGTPYQDSRHPGEAQRIPGRVECAYYDRGGEGVAYHDTEATNSGSGKLNPADGTYLNQFRMDEGVDISYTKLHNEIDNSPYNLVQPNENQLYVGWTEPGEWFNLTVEVAQSGVYSADLSYTSNRGGTISIDVNGKTSTAPLTIKSTFNASDPVAWRQWHHWNLAQDIVQLRLPKGRSVLTVHILSEGNMNLRISTSKKLDSICRPIDDRHPTVSRPAPVTRHSQVSGPESGISDYFLGQHCFRLADHAGTTRKQCWTAPQFPITGLFMHHDTDGRQFIRYT